MSDTESNTERIARLERENEATRKATAEAEARNRDGRLRDAAEDALIKLGVSAEHRAAVLAIVHREERRLIEDEQGRPAWANSPGSAWEDPVPVVEGMAAWLDSKEGRGWNPKVQRENAARAAAKGGNTGGSVMRDGTLDRGALQRKLREGIGRALTEQG